jgi:hypothetical protein
LYFTKKKNRNQSLKLVILYYLTELARKNDFFLFVR